MDYNPSLAPQTTFRAFIQVWLTLVWSKQQMKNSLFKNEINHIMPSVTTSNQNRYLACGVLCINISSEYLKEVLEAILIMYLAQQMICGKNEYIQQL